MSEMKIEYIIIPPKKRKKSVESILLDCLNTTDYSFVGDFFITDNKHKVGYRFEQNSGADRCYLQLSTEMRFPQNVKMLEQFDTILSGEINNDLSITKSFDGISMLLCEKLYPLFGEFERKLRYLVLLVLTKAFGDNWDKETVPDELEKSVKKKTRGNYNTKKILEQLDLHEMQSFLFDKREKNINALLDTVFSREALDSKSKEDIIDIINDSRPVSLWERNFHDIGDAEKWEQDINSIRACRNNIAHHKSIKYQEYLSSLKVLKGIISNLDKAIIKIKERDFTDENRFDVLTRFELLSQLNDKLASLFTSYDMTNINRTIGSALNNLSRTNSKGNTQKYGNVMENFEKAFAAAVRMYNNKEKNEKINNMINTLMFWSEQPLVKEYQLYLDEVDSTGTDNNSNDKDEA